MAWNGAGGWVIFSHDRQVNFSRTVWITFHCRGTTSSVSVIVFAELGQLAAAARAGRRAGDHHALARQMRRKGRAHRLLAGERAHRRALGWRGGGLVLGCAAPPLPRVAVPAGRAACGRAPRIGRTARAAAWRSAACSRRPSPRRRRREPRPLAAPRVRRPAPRSAPRSLRMASRAGLSHAGKPLPHPPSGLSRRVAALSPPPPAARSEPGSASQFRQAYRPAAPG